MAKSRTEQIAPLSGVAFFVLFLGAALLVNNYSYLPSGGELQSFFTDAAFRIQIAGYIGSVSGVLLIWFAGSVRSSLRPAEGGTGRLSAVAFGGGAVGGGLVAIAFSVLQVGGARGGNVAGIGVETATIIYDVYGAVVGVALPVALAALIGAAAVVAFRTRTWPSWLAWISAILAVGSISPVAYIFIGIDLLWILYVGIWLFITERKATAPTG
jgi:hypothetical protein